MSTDPQHDCLFCRIASGRAPAVTLMEDSDLIAILDIFPATRGHALIIPRPHAENLLDIEAGIVAALPIRPALH